MRTLTRLLLAVALVVAPALWSPPAASAQTTVTQTTLSAAVNASIQTLNVASGTGFDVGDVVVIDREAMRVTSVSGTTIGVRRGTDGTAPGAHGTLAEVYVGAPDNFYQTEVAPGATCTSTNERYLPRVVLPTGNVYNCVGSLWQRIGGDVGAVYVTCRALLVADQIDQSCFIADRDYIVANITEVHTTAESGGTLGLLVTRQQGTEAPASGDALVSSIDMVGAGAVAQTVKTATLTTTAADRILDAGDRIGLDFTGDTAGELAGVLVTITLVPR
jgi:hypothetical protein